MWYQQETLEQQQKIKETSKVSVDVFQVETTTMKDILS